MCAMYRRIAVILCILAIFGVSFYKKWKPEQKLPVIKNTAAMILLTSAFQDNGVIPKKYTCDGPGINPELRIEGAPEEAKSFALVMDDPDAPQGTFTHWLLWNIDPKATLIKEESIPAGSVEGKNSGGSTGYMGPCPPSGTHHYHFTCYALNTMLDLPAGADRAAFETHIANHVITEAQLVGTYSR